MTWQSGPVCPLQRLMLLRFPKDSMTDACRRRNIDLQLTADERRHAQTFLPADPAGKEHVNRYAIKKFQSYLILIWYLKIL